MASTDTFNFNSSSFDGTLKGLQRINVSFDTTASAVRAMPSGYPSNKMKGILSGLTSPVTVSVNGVIKYVQRYIQSIESLERSLGAGKNLGDNPQNVINAINEALKLLNQYDDPRINRFKKEIKDPIKHTWWTKPREVTYIGDDGKKHVGKGMSYKDWLTGKYEYKNGKQKVIIINGRRSSVPEYTWKTDKNGNSYEDSKDWTIAYIYKNHKVGAAVFDASSQIELDTLGLRNRKGKNKYQRRVIRSSKDSFTYQSAYWGTTAATALVSSAAGGEATTISKLKPTQVKKAVKAVKKSSNMNPKKLQTAADRKSFKKAKTLKTILTDLANNNKKAFVNYVKSGKIGKDAAHSATAITKDIMSPTDPKSMKEAVVTEGASYIIGKQVNRRVNYLTKGNKALSNTVSGRALKTLTKKGISKIEKIAIKEAQEKNKNKAHNRL